MSPDTRLETPHVDLKYCPLSESERASTKKLEAIFKERVKSPNTTLVSFFFDVALIKFDSFWSCQGFFKKMGLFFKRRVFPYLCLLHSIYAIL